MTTEHDHRTFRSGFDLRNVGMPRLSHASWWLSHLSQTIIQHLITQIPGMEDPLRIKETYYSTGPIWSSGLPRQRGSGKRDSTRSEGINVIIRGSISFRVLGLSDEYRVAASFWAAIDARVILGSLHFVGFATTWALRCNFDALVITHHGIRRSSHHNDVDEAAAG